MKAEPSSPEQRGEVLETRREKVMKLVRKPNTRMTVVPGKKEEKK